MEAFIYQAILNHFFEEDPESLIKVLSKVRDQLFVRAYCAPETIIVILIMTGVLFE